jgi:hypothetical protein
MEDESERTWKKNSLDLIELLTLKFLGGTKENQEKHHSEWPVSLSRFKPLNKNLVVLVLDQSVLYEIMLIKPENVVTSKRNFFVIQNITSYYIIVTIFRVTIEGF